MLAALRKLLSGSAPKPRPPRYVEQSQEQWEKEYTSERWDIFDTPAELSRYMIIVGYYGYFLKRAGRVLDVGCGYGTLQEKLLTVGYTSYVGIDLSNEAIKRAADKVDERTEFQVADAREFHSEEPFDCVVFNEVLCYLPDAVGVLRKYQALLQKDGIIIISQFCDDNIDYEENWKRIDTAFPPADGVKISHQSGYEWIIKAYRFAEPS